jgi:gamma-glutamylcyclotransferase (GGCT)/AIG2-like uncharacterized protein YtfP
VNAISSGAFILENMTVYEEKNLVICNGNEYIIVYRSLEGGKHLEERYRFRADFSQKESTIVYWFIIRILFVYPVMAK